MFKITLVKNDASKAYDITPVTIKISWDSVLSTSSTMTITTTWSNYYGWPKNPIEIGDLIIISKGDTEINRGIIVKSNDATKGIIIKDKQPDAIPVIYTIYDYGWYLGKSKSVYQFNNIPAKQAIEKILNDFRIPVGNIIEMPNLIDSIFVQKSPAEIMSSVIKSYEKQTGNRVYAEFRKGKLYVEKMADAVVIGKFNLATNIESYNILDAIISADCTQSIEEMRNRIKIILVEQDNFETIALEQDIESISKFGLIEEVYKIDEADRAKAGQVAKILLERQNKIHQTNKLTLMGDINFKAGRLFDVEVAGKTTRYMIVEAQHNVEAGAVHTMSLTLKLPEEVA